LRLRMKTSHNGVFGVAMMISSGYSAACATVRAWRFAA
jgi:hypothetical protein